MAAPLAENERCFGVTNIKTHIHLKLDLNDHNYDAWRELLLTHCLTFDVIGHIDGTSLPNGDNDQQWLKHDGLVKLWIYGTLTPELFRSAFKTGGTARDIWLRIENQFRNNKEARAIQLENELRTMEIGDLSIQDYCQTMKSISDLLSNVDAPINEHTLVMSLLNGLNKKYDNIINVIQHKEPFPSFDNAKSMLQMEENRLKRSIKSTASHTTHSSSAAALNVSEHKVQNNQQQRFNNHRGRGRSRGRGRYNNYNRGNFNQNWNQNGYWSWNPYSPQNCGSAPARPPTFNQQQANFIDFQPATALSQAFQTETLQDLSMAEWYMDSGASAHITGSAGPSNSENTSPM